MQETNRTTSDAETLLLSCIRQLNSTDDFEGVMHHVLTTILTYYGGARAYVFEFDWESNTTSNTHEVCAEGVSPEINNLQNLPIMTVQTWIHVFEHSDVFVIDDVEKLAHDPQRREEYETLHSQNILALIAVPIRYKEQLHGFLGVDDPTVNTNNSDFLTNLTYFICNEMDKRKLNEELRKLSFSDYLTQFNNRNAYNAYLRSLNTQVIENVGVVFADLNSLKYMNDTYGHEYGDRLLCHMADILKRHFPEKNIFRISGDEFVVIYPECANGHFQNAVTQLHKDLISKNEELAAVGDVWVSKTTVLQPLIYQAEQMMYKNKQQYHAIRPTAKDKRSELIHIFFEKMKQDTFTFYLQPQLDLRSHQIVGAEVLARRINSNGDIILPYDFIPLFEKEGYISKLDFYLFEQVCVLLAEWKTRKCSFFPLSVNFSSLTLSEPDFSSRFTDLIEQYQINPDQIIVEISRSGNSLDRRKLKALIQQLNQIGIDVCIKNLTMENDFPAMMTLDGVKCVKLDLSLIREMEEHYRTQLLVQTLIQLCHRMGQICMATGVESQKQADMLQAMDCDVIQGFFLGYPLSIEDFMKEFADSALFEKVTLSKPSTSNTAAFHLKSQFDSNQTPLDSIVFELLCRSSDQTYLYLANLSTDFSRWSPAAVDYFGLPGEYLNNTADVWCTYIHPDDAHIFLEDMGNIFEGKSNRHDCEYRARNAEGDYVWVRCSGMALRNQDGTPGFFVGSMVNLGSVSKFDPVTGLLSPYQYQEQLQQLLDQGVHGSMLLFGIDHFKHLNDVHGYQTGDMILRYIGQKVQLISNCTFYRMDGDKFSCIITNANKQDIFLIYKNVCRLFKTLPQFNNYEIHLSVSCGVVLFPEQGEQMGVLRANAEYALEQSKKQERGSIAFYSEDLHKKFLSAFHLQEVLHRAINKSFEGFALHYQPLIDSKTGSLYGAEALLRFSSPSLPPVYPDTFIPVLEESGDINQVGAWIMRTAFEQAKKWRKSCPDFHITINVSYIQMQRPDFRTSLIRELQESGLPAEALIIELTESCKITEPEKLKTDFQFFSSQHIQMALDDFGTGYSSIALLRELSPDWIKIDHTFVASITESPTDRAIIEYLMDLCHHAQIRVCIEGVETNEIKEIVRTYHPDTLQGYYYSKPVPAELFKQQFLD